MKLSKIKGNPNNPRIIKDDKFKKLVKSISEFPKMLEMRPIIVDENFIVQGGNMRLKALQELKYKDIPDEWVKQVSDLTEEQKKEFIIKDNVGFGEWDFDDLANNWDVEKLEDWGLDIPDFAVKELEAEEDDFEIPEEIKTDIVLGDLFEIGEHRLLCGDSTDSDAVAKLLNGKEPYLMITDPPYGVIYKASWRNEAMPEKNDPNRWKDAKGRDIGEVLNDDNADWTDAWALSPAKVTYVWHAGTKANIVQNSLERCDFNVRAQIIWNKSHFAISRGDYHVKHEPCWYAVKKGNKGNWASDRKQTTVWDINKPQKSETGHSTQKPVECMSKPISNHDGDVYDPFLGSGTTMVASHQLKRKCYGMELDPKYCQVIIDRMKKLDPSLIIKKNGVEITHKNLL